MRSLLTINAFALLLIATHVGASEPKLSGNPLFPGHYADPEGIIFGDTYWIYPTYSAPYDEQLHFDCFSSKDLMNWTKHERVLDNRAIKWARRAMWAPSVIEKEGKYYFFSGRTTFRITTSSVVLASPWPIILPVHLRTI
jgi:beta-xylosidase